jgi:hypothetical protein
VREVSDPAVAHVIREEMVLRFGDRVQRMLHGTPPGCCAGTRYFTFTATRAGHATIVLYNCFQGCHTPDALRYSATQRWDVTVG